MRITPTHDHMLEMTSAWTGDRFDDGRPRVPDRTLERLRAATTEHAWWVLSEAGYGSQFSGGWRQTHPGQALVGRCVTSQFLPRRPDYDAATVAAGAREGHHQGGQQNSWIIESLRQGDVMVTDIFGKIKDGTVLGDNLGTAVAARTGVGAVIDGGVRDYTGLTALDAPTNIFFRDTDPSAIEQVTLAGINQPILIGGVTVLPGDIAIGTPSGVIFIPPQLAEEVAEYSEDVRVRDVFGKTRLAEGRYTSADVDVAVWPDYIEEDFRAWKDARSAEV